MIAHNYLSYYKFCALCHRLAGIPIASLARLILRVWVDLGSKIVPIEISTSVHSRPFVSCTVSSQPTFVRPHGQTTRHNRPSQSAMIACNRFALKQVLQDEDWCAKNVGLCWIPWRMAE